MSHRVTGHRFTLFREQVYRILEIRHQDLIISPYIAQHYELFRSLATHCTEAEPGVRAKTKELAKIRID